MKTIYSMGKGKYITLDSYGETHETRHWSIAIALLSLLLATISGMALVGVDPTNINPQTNPQQNNEALRRTHG
jgi:hypothetical protein